MEPAEVALVVDGQAFQKVCLETGAGGEASDAALGHTWAATNPVFKCHTEAWGSLVTRPCGREYCVVGTEDKMLKSVSSSYKVGPIARNGCKHFYLLSSHQPWGLLKVTLPLGIPKPAWATE